MKWWQTKQLAQPQVCTRCGKTPLHCRMHCLVVCHGCGKRSLQVYVYIKPQSGHSSSTSGLRHLSRYNTHSDVAANSAEGIPWTTNVTLNNHNLELKIETGADVTVIPEANYRKDHYGPLRNSERLLTGAGQHTEVISYFNLQLVIGVSMQLYFPPCMLTYFSC